MKPTAAVLLLLVTAACVAPAGDEDLGRLLPGRLVEAKGVVRDGHPVYTEIDEVQPGPDDRGGRLEVNAPTESATATGVRLLGTEFGRDARTEYEDRQRQSSAPFTPASGDWLRLKARLKDGAMHARSLRPIDARDQFKVTGEVLAVDPAGLRLDVGGIALPVSQDFDLSLLGEKDPDDPLSLFLADDQKSVPFTVALGDHLRLGGQAAYTYDHQDEYDLDRSRDRDRHKQYLDGKLDLLWLIDDRGSYGLFEVAGGFHETRRQNSADSHEDLLEVSRAFGSTRLGDHVQLLVGRQDFTDEREWLYDQVLDGARVVGTVGPLELELSASMGREALAEHNEFVDTDLFAALLRLHLDREWRLTAYVLQRNDATPTDFEPRLWGLRSYARYKKGLSHWFELARADGHDGARAISGYAIDGGAGFTFDLPWRPTLFGGVAFGSGERDGAGHEGFRQTGLQDNNGKLGGVTKLRYYGEVYDPELANLLVTTGGLSLRPLRDFSLTALFHSYAQDVGSTRFPDSNTSNLRPTPLGTATALGREYDLVLGYRYRNLLTLEFVYGRFDPGAAFLEETVAQKFEFTARIGF